MNKKRILITCICITGCVVAAGIYKVNGSGVSAETLPVQKGEIKQYVEDTAVVECNNMQTVYIEGIGKITEIKLDTGEEVKKGDLLLTMDSTDLEMQLKDANAKIAAAQSQVSGTKIGNYSNQIGIAEAAVQQAQVTSDSAQRNLQTAQALFDAGVISREEWSKAQDAYKAASAALKTAELGLSEAKKGSPDYVKKGYSSQLEQALIFRDTILKSIEKQKVLSPLDGVVLEKLVEENSTAAAGTPAFIIGDIKNLKLEANILSDDSYKIKLGDEVEITGKVLENAIVKGKVSKIAPSAKTMTSTLGVNQKRVEVEIEITGDYGLLKPGYNVDIKIITNEVMDTVTVPDSAVFDYKGSPCVFVVDNGKAAIRQVKKGLEGYKLIEIIEGLKEGDTILTKPDNTIKEGIKINPAK